MNEVPPARHLLAIELPWPKPPRSTAKADKGKASASEPVEYRA